MDFDRLKSRDHAIFSVADQSFCLWDPQLYRTNLSFLERLDHKYFKFHLDAILAADGEGNKYRAATAIRLLYYHASETLFALLAATVQAPDCVVGWMLKYTNKRLRDVVESIHRGNFQYPRTSTLARPSWEELSEAIYAFSNADPAKRDENARLFASLWKRLAIEFLDPKQTVEYNSLKHGMRAGSGEFTLAVGIEETPGVPAPPEKMHLLGASEFSHTFWTAEPILKTKGDPNLSLVHSTLSWDPESTAHAVILISYSVQNVISFLKILSGVDPTTVIFSRPSDLTDFEKPFSNPPSVPHFQMKYDIDFSTAKLYTRDDIDRITSQRPQKSNRPPA